MMPSPHFTDSPTARCPERVSIFEFRNSNTAQSADADAPTENQMSENRPAVNLEDRAVVANLSDQEYFSNLATLGAYRVPPRGAGERWSRMEVFGRWELFDLGDGRKGEKYWTAQEIAQSVLAEHNPDADLRRFGVFLCSGGAPTEEEISAAQARQDAFYMEQIQQADLVYSRTPHRPDAITDVQRRAARALGIDRPWLVKLAAMSECPACGDSVRAGAAVCRHCGAILDEEKAARFGIVRRPADALRETNAEPEKAPEGAAVGAGWGTLVGKKKHER
jgi:ribosomal protein L32